MQQLKISLVELEVILFLHHNVYWLINLECCMFHATSSWCELGCLETRIELFKLLFVFFSVMRLHLMDHVPLIVEERSAESLPLNACWYTPKAVAENKFSSFLPAGDELTA